MNDVLSRKILWLMTPIFGLVERWTFSSAARINIVSKGFLSYFNEKYPTIPISFFTNGIDDEFLIPADVSSALDRRANNTSNTDLEILYAGNVGEGQGLENIIPELAVKLGDKVKIRIIGAGGRLVSLETKLDELGCENVIIMSPVERSQLIGYYNAADVLFLHLNNYEAFLKVLPSKIFEYAAMGKPILAGVAGYAKEFLDDNVDNAVVFPPCDVERAQIALEQLVIKTEFRVEFISQYSRLSIMNKMADDILNTSRVEH
jgi:glycosyltransferase involved in cell wall biosynthesis